VSRPALLQRGQCEAIWKKGSLLMRLGQGEWYCSFDFGAKGLTQLTRSHGGRSPRLAIGQLAESFSWCMVHLMLWLQPAVHDIPSVRRAVKV
jgi:hypothetical protein